LSLVITAHMMMQRRKSKWWVLAVFREAWRNKIRLYCSSTAADLSILLN
jgi:hypothetical protein